MSVVTADDKFGFIQVPDFGSTALVQLKSEFGQDFALKYFDLCEKTVALNARCVPLVYGSARTSSSGSVGSSCGGSRSPSGPTATRLASIQAVDSWRRSGVDVPSKRKKVPDGYCYTKLFRRESAESVAMGVGAYPTFATLTRMAARKFQDLECLERFRLVEQTPGVYHVAAGGQAGVSFLGAVYGRSQCMPGTPSGSFVDRVASAGERQDVAKVDPKAVVGGFAVPHAGHAVSGEVVAKELKCRKFASVADEVVGELMHLMSGGMASAVAVDRYVACLARIVGLKKSAPPGFPGFGIYWDRAEEILADIVDVGTRQVTVYEFASHGASALAERDKAMAAMDEAHPRHAKQVVGTCVRYTAASEVFGPRALGVMDARRDLISRYHFSTEFLGGVVVHVLTASRARPSGCLDRDYPPLL